MFYVCRKLENFSTIAKHFRNSKLRFISLSLKNFNFAFSQRVHQWLLSNPLSQTILRQFFCYFWMFWISKLSELKNSLMKPFSIWLRSVNCSTRMTLSARYYQVDNLRRLVEIQREFRYETWISRLTSSWRFAIIESDKLDVSNEVQEQC